MREASRGSAAPLGELQHFPGDRRRHHKTTRRSRLAALAALIAASPLVVVALPSAPATASIGTDHNKVAAIEAKIASEGNAAQKLVGTYNQDAERLAALKHSIAADSSALHSDRATVVTATTHVRQWAIAAYISAVSGDSAAASLFSPSGSTSNLSDVQAYLGVTSGTLDNAVAALTQDEDHTTAAEHSLQQQESATEAALSQLATARQAAQAGIAADEQLLGSVNANLRALVTAAEARAAQAKEESQEETLGANAQVAPVAPSAQPTIAAAPGKYANPLRGARGISPERIDQGVDYQGFGPIYAIGDGVVLSTFCGGWPGGTFISYRLTDGPAAGLVVYAAEDIEPQVQVGQSVTANTVIGQIYEGYTGIETGWADSSGDGTTMAADSRQFYGANSTGFGANFSALLQSLGAPGGVLQNNPPTGGVPAGWPQW